MATNILGNLSGGWFNKLGISFRTLLAVGVALSAVCGMVVYTAVLPFGLQLMAAILFSFLGGVAPATMFATVGRVTVTPAQSGLLVGLLFQGAGAGQVIGPLVLGAMIDSFGGWFIAPVFFMICMLLWCACCEPATGNANKVCECICLSLGCKKTIDLSGQWPAVAEVADATDLSKEVIQEAAEKGAVWLRAAQGASQYKKPCRVRSLDNRFKARDQILINYDREVLLAVPPSVEMISDQVNYSVWYKPPGVLSQGTKWGDHCSMCYLVRKKSTINPQCLCIVSTVRQVD